MLKSRMNRSCNLGIPRLRLLAPCHKKLPNKAQGVQMEWFTMGVESLSSLSRKQRRKPCVVTWQKWAETTHAHAAQERNTKSVMVHRSPTLRMFETIQHPILRAATSGNENKAFARTEAEHTTVFEHRITANNAVILGDFRCLSIMLNSYGCSVLWETASVRM